MKFPLSWLKDYLATTATLDELLGYMLKAGLEVEEVENPAEDLKAFTVCKVTDAKPHPDADKLRVCTVDTVDGEKQIVCGAPNARAGMTAIYAPLGSYIPGLDFSLDKKPRKIRGVESHGMMCSTKELNAGLLKRLDLELFQYYDETEYIRSAIGLVQQNIFVGSALTIIVLLMFLHLGRRTLLAVPLIACSAVATVLISPWFFLLTLLFMIGAGLWFGRGALVVGLAIPVSVIGTFLLLGLMGRSLNVISLAGLAFAVGMLVDNAVVVLENIYRRVQAGESAATAASAGTSEVAGAVVASTLTTIAVFVPVPPGSLWRSEMSCCDNKSAGPTPDNCSS